MQENLAKQNHQKQISHKRGDSFLNAAHCTLCNAQYTPPTRLNCRVESRRARRQSGSNLQSFSVLLIQSQLDC